MDFPHEGKYNVQSIQMHLYSLVKQLLFQHLRSSCRKGRRGGREEAVPTAEANTKLLQAWFKSWFIKLSKVQDITATDHNSRSHGSPRHGCRDSTWGCNKSCFVVDPAHAFPNLGNEGSITEGSNSTCGQEAQLRSLSLAQKLYFKSSFSDAVCNMGKAFII